MLNYKFIDKSVWLEKEKILVIADLHLGYEEMLREQGVFIPKTQYKEIISELEKIFSVVGKMKEIIILGDLKHEFGTISSQEWKETLDLIDFLKKKTGKIILIKGNHDNYLINILKKQNIKLVDFYIKDNLAFIHGHKLFPEVLNRKIKYLFVGHMHPAISIREGVKSEIYKCFLVGKFKNKELVILPSFFPLVEGADVSIENTNLAFKPNLKEFEVYVVGDEVYDFGKVKDVGRLI